MIVPTEELGRLSGQVTMVDGGFDPLHPGHVEYMRAAHELGAPVLCNVSGDDWVGRKHPPLLPQEQRCLLIDAIRWVDYVHPSHTTTAEVLKTLKPRYYAKGDDWKDRLPEDEVAICEANGIEIVFLDTVRDSSTAILKRFTESREQE